MQSFLSFCTFYNADDIAVYSLFAVIYGIYYKGYRIRSHNGLSAVA